MDVTATRSSVTAAAILSLALAGCAPGSIVGGDPPPREEPEDGGDPLHPSPLPAVVPGRVVVRLAEDAALVRRYYALDDRVEASAALRDLAARVEIRSVEPLTSRARTSYDESRASVAARALESTFVVELDETHDVRALAAFLSARDDVVYAEPELELAATFVPDDELYAPDTTMWGLGVMEMESAWDLSETRGDGVIVAVVDTGVDLAHPDLVDNLWVNEDEIPDNGVDDDGNGYVDDVRGWSFVDGGADPSDRHGHGTHVAGTIAAVGDNGAGVIGVAHRARVMALKGLGDDGRGGTIGLALAIRYAVDNGARVINDSWGGPGLSRVTRDAIAYAHASDVVVVDAAGNDGVESCRFTPAREDLGISVSAFDSTDALASYSNFGTQIDVGAPGGGAAGSGPIEHRLILSSLPRDSALQRERPSYPVFEGARGGLYFPLAGTSMAAPHVSGLVALIRAAHPTFSVEQIRQALRQRADDVGVPGFDAASGYGRVNARRALEPFDAPPAVANLYGLDGCDEPVSAVAVRALVAGSTPEAEPEWVLELGVGPTFGDRSGGLGAFAAVASGVGRVDGEELWSLADGGALDGDHLLRLTVFDPATGARATDVARFRVDENRLTGFEAGRLASLDAVHALHGRVVARDRFVGYRVDYARGSGVRAAPFTPIAPVAEFDAPVEDDGPLARWDTRGLAAGGYTLRLTATYTDGVVEDFVDVTLDGGLSVGFPISLGTETRVSPKVADLDGDGAMEIVVGGAAFDARGRPVVGWPAVVGSRGRTTPAIADADADGALEVFSVEQTRPDASRFYRYAVQARAADGALRWSVPLGGGRVVSIVGPPSVGDVDGDGALEVVVPAKLGASMSWLVLDARTGEQEQEIQLGLEAYGAAALADLDSDGAEDLVVSGRRAEGPFIAAIRGTGEPLPGFPVAGSRFDLRSCDPAVADLDGDGDLEIVVGQHALHHDGSIVTGWPQSTRLRSAAIGVVDDDPRPTIALAWTPGVHAQYQILEADGARRHTLWRDQGENVTVIDALGEPANGNPILADVDGDGVVDLLAFSHLGQRPGAPSALYGWDARTGGRTPGMPRFVPTPEIPVVSTTPAVGDVDGDGLLELVAVAAGALYVWDLDAPARSRAPWPMYQHDLRSSGAYCPGCAAGSVGGCADRLRSGEETDVDCGGPVCPPCVVGRACAGPADCTTFACGAGRCLPPPACDDGVTNGDETSVDCGGPTCGPCGPGGACAAPRDCEDGVCASGTCAPASCEDGVTNGAESDVDCGAGCPACGVGSACRTGDDCEEGVCPGGVCGSPSCDDGVSNGRESDVDCGGPCPSCPDGARCAEAADCLGGGCDSGVCVTPGAAPTFLGWASWMQSASAMSDDAQDAAMASACASTFPASRAATVEMIVDRVIEGLPASNTSGRYVVPACPRCEGRAYSAAVDGHARRSVAPGGAWPVSIWTGLDGTHTGTRAAMCVR